MSAVSQRPPQQVAPQADGSGGADRPATGPAVDLTSIGKLIAPLVAAVGALAATGTIGRVQRDEPGWFCVALGFVIVAGTLWALAPAFKKRDSTRTQTIMLAIATGLAAVGVAIALVLAVMIANNEPRPQISASLTDGNTRLSTTISASNMQTNRRLVFRVDALREGNFHQSIYRAYVGPDGDGNVRQTIVTSLPDGDYDEVGIKAYTGTESPTCDDFTAVKEDSTIGPGTGCVILMVPSRTGGQAPGVTQGGSPESSSNSP